MVPECRHEFEVAALVRAGRWPDACEPDLRAHVHGCAECREAVTIAELLLQADRGAEVHVPSAAQMWWRLAVRARLEREQAAARPVVWLQGIAAACGVGVVLTVLGQLAPVLSGAAAVGRGPRCGHRAGRAAGRGTRWSRAVAARRGRCARPRGTRVDCRVSLGGRRVAWPEIPPRADEWAADRVELRLAGR